MFVFRNAHHDKIIGAWKEMHTKQKISPLAIIADSSSGNSDKSSNALLLEKY